MPGLAFQTVSVPMSGGIDQKSAPKQVGLGKLLKCQNGVWVQRNRIDKRSGSTQLVEHPVTYPNNPGSGMWNFDDELLVSGFTAGTGGADQYSLSPNSNSWVPKGAQQPIGIGLETIASSVFNHSAQDAATSNGITVYAYEVPTFSTATETQIPSLNATVIDESDGTAVLSDVVIAFNGTDCRVVAFGAYICVFYVSSGGQLACAILATGRPAAGFTLTTVVGPGFNANSAGLYEARAVMNTVSPALPFIAVVYGNSANGGGTLIGLSVAGGATPSLIFGLGISVNGIPPPLNLPFALTFFAQELGFWYCPSAGQLGLAVVQSSVSGNTKLYIGWYSNALVQTAVPTIFATTTVGWGNVAMIARSHTQAYFLYEEGGPRTFTPSSQPHIGAAILTIGSATLPPPKAPIVLGLTLASDLFHPSQGDYTDTYFLSSYASLTQPTNFVVDVNGVVVGKALQNYSGGATTRFRLPSPFLDANSANCIPNAATTQNTIIFDTKAVPVCAVVKTVLSMAASPSASQLGANLHVTGGLLAMYDGAAFQEHNFNVYPEPPTLSYGCPIAVSRAVIGTPGTSEVTNVAFPSPLTSPSGLQSGSGWLVEPGSYLVMFDSSATVYPAYVWFSVDGAGADPVLNASGYTHWTAVHCALLSTDSDLDCCLKLAAAIGTAPTVDIHFSVALIGVAGGVPVSGACLVQITAANSNQPGYPSSFSDVLTATASVGTASVAWGDVICPPGNRILPGGYWVAYNTYVVWYQVDGVGTAPANPNTKNGITGSGIQVPITSAMSAAQVGATTLAALGTSGYPAFVPSVAAPGWPGGTPPPQVVISIYSGTPITASNLVFNQNSSGNLYDTNQGVAGSGTQTIWDYVVTYSKVDAQGQIHRSAPSTPTLLVVNGAYQGNVNGQPTGGCLPRLAILNYRATQLADVNIEVWRTVANTTALNYFRVSSPALPIAQKYPVVGPLANNPESDYWASPALGPWPVGFYDVLPDQQILSNPGLYTNGGTLPNAAAPSLIFVHQHRNRLYGFGSENPNQVVFSQQFIPGSQTAPAFNASLVLNFDPIGGPLTALASMDEKLIIFEQNAIFYMQGDGPQVNGTNSNFVGPDRITTDCGCIDPGSIVTFPGGIFFRSAKGIQLLSRNLQGDYTVGSSVEQAIAAGTVVSAVLMPDRQEIRFSVQTALVNNVAQGYTLVYNYFFNAWSQFITGAPDSGGNVTNGTLWTGPATIWNGSYVYLAGQVYQETPGIGADQGSPFSLLIQTPWFKPAQQLQAYQRVSKVGVLGDFHSPHLLEMLVGYDYEGAVYPIIWNPNNLSLPASQFGADATYGSSSVYGNALDGQRYQCRAHMPRGPCEAIQLTIFDTAQSAPYTSFSLDDLTLEVGLENSKLYPQGPLRTTG